MPLNAQETKPIKLRHIMDGCNEQTFIARVAETVMLTQEPPAIGSLYSAWALPGKMSLRGTLMAYQCTGAETGDVPEGYLAWNFAAPKSDADKRVPFRTYSNFDDKDWDDILLAFGTIEDKNFPRSTLAAIGGVKTLVSAPNYIVRPVVIPGGPRGTQLIVREFISPTPFSIPAHETPVPTLVVWDIAGKSGMISALHDDIPIPKTRTAVASVAGDASGTSSGVITGQMFPATNHVTWTTHFIFDKQVYQNGVFIRTQIEAIAPPIPEAISIR